MKIAFHSYQLGERGTEVSLYDYARYNEEILGNESIIVSTSSRPTPALEKFEKRFKVLFYPDVWNERDNTPLRKSLEKIVSEEKVDVFYAQKGGENDDILPTNCKTLAHAVFNMRSPHGDVYAGISEYLAKRDGYPLWVPYIVDLPDIKTDLRAELGIPKDAIVVGRHGGKDTFNINFAWKAIFDIIEEKKDLYFLFLNTNKVVDHPRIIHLPLNNDLEYKRTFINTCNVMIHSRMDGETFGLAVAEFSLCNKPVITYDGPNICGVYDRSHLDILKGKAIKYNSYSELKEILSGLDDYMFDVNEGYWDAYSKDFNPKTVMERFKRIFL
jgi:hypothetical protein